VVNIAFFMIFAVFDLSPLTVCINCSFYIYLYSAKINKWINYESGRTVRNGKKSLGL